MNMDSRDCDEKPGLKLFELGEEQKALDKILANQMQEKYELSSHQMQRQQQQKDTELMEILSASAYKHYEYILPLVKDIYELELKIQEKQKEYNKKNWQKRAALLGQDILADSLKEDQCVLKRWSTELTTMRQASQDYQVTDPHYKVSHQENCLKECLAFTVLAHSVHIRLKILTQLPCRGIHFLRPQTFKVLLDSDTFVPDLEATVVSTLTSGGPVAHVVSLVAKYIREDIAPFVIVVPAKKKKSAKNKKSKSTEQTATQNVDIPSGNPS